MKICPNCKLPKGKKSHIRGTGEKRLFFWLRLHPYRCNACERRFYRFRLQNGGTGPVKPPKPLTPRDHAEFEKLIGEMRAFEEKLMDSHSETSPDNTEDHTIRFTGTKN